MVDGVLCDPQLGCSKSLVMQDLSRSRSEQYNQELRLVSSFDGDWNFSIGVNFTRFSTSNDCFVFANALTYLTNYYPFNWRFSQCGSQGLQNVGGVDCTYVDPNPLESINGEGHNYFRSDNPYRLTSSAMFGELYWQATETLRVTTGLRFTWDRKVFSHVLLRDYRTLVAEGDAPEQCVNAVFCPLSGIAPGGRGAASLPDIVQEWREPTGRIVLDWKPDLPFTDDTMIYASAAQTAQATP